jgi:hypothetical protein
MRQSGGGLVDAQSVEVAQAHDFGGFGIGLLQARDRFVEDQESSGLLLGRGRSTLSSAARSVTA